jgi:hypothetical protein
VPCFIAREAYQQGTLFCTEILQCKVIRCKKIKEFTFIKFILKNFEVYFEFTQGIYTIYKDSACYKQK